MYRTLAFLSLAAAVQGQGACTLAAEKKPTLSWQTCTGSGCTSQTNNIVVDANWRWTHATNGSTNCYTGNTWDKTLCPSNDACAANCCVDGADYSGTYGITTSGSSLNINFVTQGSGKNIGSRVYLMASDTKYQMFNLLGNEFTFDVDVSKLPCGINGALYFVSMDADGGMAKYPTNKAGAAYGTGYCDAQCARDIKFINGQANVEGWKPSATDANAGVGNYGTCCSEMDIWEANSMATAVTTHPCKTPAQRRCKEEDCGGSYSEDRYGGDCDPDGCDFNAYRMGVTDFYGKGMTVDTSKVMTVVTQFLTNPAGELGEVKRFYLQNGTAIPQPATTVSGVSGNSINEPFCKAQKTAFGDTDYHTPRGGLAGMGSAMKAGMVLVMSIWDDHYANMLWLDSNNPANSTKTGAKRGACAITSGKPTEVEADNSIKVIFSNIKFGPINSTFKATA